MQKTKSIITNLVKGLLAIALVYWLIGSGKLNLRALQELLNPYVLTVSLILIGLNLVINSERWRILLQSQGLASERLATFKYTLIGLFFNYAIPGGVGGDVIKGYYVVKNNPHAKAKAAVTVAMDRLIGLYTMLFMAIAVMLYDWEQVLSHPQLKWIFLLVLGLFLGFSCFWAIIFSKRLSSLKIIHQVLGRLPKAEHLLKLYSSFAQYSDSKMILFSTFFVSLLSQSIAILFFVFIGQSLGFTKVSLHTYFFVVPIGFMVTAIPISPAGVGVGQAAFYYLFSLIEPDSGNAGSIGITAQQLFLFVFGLVGAWFYIMAGKPNAKYIASESSKDPRTL